MNRLTDIRLHAQQLVAPQFDDPVELIRWMGMVQAQEYGSAKWAVALRLRTLAAAPVEEALREGRILRMHIMRPTWHFIAAEDVRWMLHLSARRIRAANASFAKGNGCGLDEGDYLRCSRLLERILGGGNHLTRQQIAGELERAGMAVDAPRLNRLMMHAETDGVVCSGADRAGKPTYALLAERVPQAVDLPQILHHRDSLDDDIPLRGHLEKVDAAQEGGFTAAGRSDHADAFALVHVGVNALEDFELTEILVQILYVNHSYASTFPRR